MKPATLLLLAVSTLVALLAAGKAHAAPGPDSPHAIVPATSFGGHGSARLDRYASLPSWLQLKQPSLPSRSERPPAVGQYSCTPRCDPCWHWTISLPLWIPGVNADAADGDVSVDGDRGEGSLIDDGSEVLGDIEFAFVGAVTARKGRWGVGVDFLTATISASAEFTLFDGLIPFDASGKLSATIARARVDYLYSRAMAPWKISRCGCAEHRVYVGIRGYDVAVTANALGVPALTLDVEDTWVDPILGLQSEIPFARNWAFVFRGDVGGFGIDDAWSYSLMAGAHWRFANRWGITFAYNMLDFQRAFGPSSKRKKIDFNLRGPQLAIHYYLK